MFSGTARLLVSGLATKAKGTPSVNSKSTTVEIQLLTLGLSALLLKFHRTSVFTHEAFIRELLRMIRQ